MSKRITNSEGDEVNRYSEVWCQSKGRRRLANRAKRAARKKGVQNSNGNDRTVS